MGVTSQLECTNCSGPISHGMSYVVEGEVVGVASRKVEVLAVELELGALDRHVPLPDAGNGGDAAGQEANREQTRELGKHCWRLTGLLLWFPLASFRCNATTRAPSLSSATDRARPVDIYYTPQLSNSFPGTPESRPDAFPHSTTETVGPRAMSSSPTKLGSPRASPRRLSSSITEPSRPKVGVGPMRRAIVKLGTSTDSVVDRSYLMSLQPEELNSRSMICPYCANVIVVCNLVIVFDGKLLASKNENRLIDPSVELSCCCNSVAAQNDHMHVMIDHSQGISPVGDLADGMNVLFTR